MLKKTVLKVSIYIGIPLLLVFLLFQFSPLVIQQSQLNAKSAAMASAKAKTIWRQFSSAQTYVEIELNNDDVQAMAEVASHMFSNTKVAIGFNRFGVVVASTTALEPLYLNVNCTISAADLGYQIDGCYVGHIYVYGFMLDAMLRFGAWLLFDAEVSKTVAQLLTNIRVSDQSIILVTTKNSDFKERFNSSLKDVTDLAKTISRNSKVEPEKIEQYIAVLERFDSKNRSLAGFVNVVMQQALANSVNSDPQEENTAAIWALAIKFGSQRFADLAGVSQEVDSKSMTLRGREDLVLHFLYSAILQQVGRENIGLKIGEFKEILDSGKGGSGFSFADLAADKSGLAFAEFLTKSKQTAIHAQNVLAASIDESLFIPFVHDLPEGMSESSFERAVGGMNSSKYQELSADIDNRIATLRLYHESLITLPHTLLGNTLRSNSTIGSWLRLDTHIHTRFSDGSKTVAEIADNADKFGCDVIAITDHGDKNLTKVLSNEYFAEIARVQRLHPNMTIIPGFEWNIPPFKGREHATVLFADLPSMQQDLRNFRNGFDHYNEYQTQFLSIKPALEWLNNYAQRSPVKPVIIYNHPSRKDAQTTENQYDIEHWSVESDLVIGFSGAPGHQRKRGIDNGSYENVLHTQHGWDPTVAKVGGEWDRLLQRGYRVTAARAASDFHNLNMDYWPCQFSSTHLFSRSKQQNDVLQALRQGQMWAQHGRFVDSIAFTINDSANQTANIGEVLNLAGKSNSVEIKLDIKLNDKDWQGFATSLDELELITITDKQISATQLDVKANLVGKVFRVTLNQTIDSPMTVFRLRGRSIQPEQHHYMFYTNPITVSVKDDN
jgi:hypothetical protein